MESLRTQDLSQLSYNQIDIFKCIYNIPRSKEEISSILNLAEKTISNNLPIMSRELKHHDIVRYIDINGEALYAIKPHKIWKPELLQKIYSYDRSPVHPYMVVNLPEPPNKTHWNLYPFGDWHYGSSECDYLAIDTMLDCILADDNSLLLLMGDLMENASKESIADSVYRQVIMPQQQQEDIVNKMSPVSHKVLAAVGGNHGDRSVKSVYLNPDKNISDSIEVEHFDGMLYLDIICGNNKWEILACHGSTGSTTLAGRLNAIKKKNTFHTADIFLMGHTHDQQAPWDVEVRRDPKNMRLVERDRSYVLTGGFLKIYTGYANKKGYAPLPVGMPYIKLMCSGSDSPGSYTVITGRNKFIGNNSVLNGEDNEYKK